MFYRCFTGPAVCRQGCEEHSIARLCGAAGPAIDHFQQVESKGGIFWEPLVFAIGLAEAWRIGIGWAPPRSDNFNQLLNEYDMGELGFDPLGLCPTDPQEKYDMQTKELNNGR